MSDEIVLYRAMGPTDAYLLRQWLEDVGIPCRLVGESLMGLGGAIPIPDALPRVLVPKAHEAEAKEALARWQGPRLVHPARTCPHCGEDNPPSFALCWSCEQPLGDD